MKYLIYIGIALILVAVLAIAVLKISVELVLWALLAIGIVWAVIFIYGLIRTTDGKRRENIHGRRRYWNK